MKHEWRKKEKSVYLPKSKPEIIDVPNFKFLTIEGEGNPNSEHFTEFIAALYALSYGIKMCRKKGIEPEGYFDYTVYPLEGVWDIKNSTEIQIEGIARIKHRWQVSFLMWVSAAMWTTTRFCNTAYSSLTIDT